MQYMGGKARIAKAIVAAILEDTPARARWFEPFVGGGNVLEVASPHFHASAGMDAHPDLILMWNNATKGWRPPEVTRELYDNLRKGQPSALRGFVGFGASFGGKWFGGYGVSPRDGELWKPSARALDRQARVFSDNRCKFRCGSFGSYSPPSGTVVYCDPPYLGTTSYATGLDHFKFYEELSRWAETCDVYVSEYDIPSGVKAEVIWSKPKRNVLEAGDNQRLAIEKLFKIGVP